MVFRHQPYWAICLTAPAAFEWRHVRPQVPPLERRTHRKLADFLWRCAGWHDRDPRRKPLGYAVLAMALRLLSGQQSWRVYERHGCDFRLARTDFGRAWEVFLSKRIEADFQAWRRHQRYWTAEKYRRFDRGERMSPNCIEGSVSV